MLNVIVLLRVQHKFLNDLLHAIFVVACRNVICQLFESRDRIAHSHAKAGNFQHFMVIPGITDRDALAQLVTKVIRQEGKGMAFGSFTMHDLEEVWFGLGDMDFWSKQFTQVNGHFIQIVRLIDDKQFWCLLFNNFDEVRLDMVLGTIQFGVITQFVVFFASIQLVINVRLKMEIVLQAVVVQFA